MITFTIDETIHSGKYSGKFSIVCSKDGVPIWKSDGSFIEIMAMLRCARLLMAHFQAEYKVIIIPDIDDASVT